jgi:uncharacterized protein (DUF58 family)
MADYLDPEVIAKAQALGVKARTLVEGLRVGDHKSPHRGFSVEFVQHREYVPGDDIRHIYWKGYARSDRYTIKQYEQETNFTAHLMVDASNSMLYGDKDSRKRSRRRWRISSSNSATASRSTSSTWTGATGCRPAARWDTCKRSSIRSCR